MRNLTQFSSPSPSSSFISHARRKSRQSPPCGVLAFAVSPKRPANKASVMAIKKLIIIGLFGFSPMRRAYFFGGCSRGEFTHSRGHESKMPNRKEHDLVKNWRRRILPWKGAFIPRTDTIQNHHLEKSILANVSPGLRLLLPLPQSSACVEPRLSLWRSPLPTLASSRCLSFEQS